MRMKTQAEAEFSKIPIAKIGVKLALGGFVLLIGAAALKVFKVQISPLVFDWLVVGVGLLIAKGLAIVAGTTHAINLRMRRSGGPYLLFTRGGAQSVISFTAATFGVAMQLVVAFTIFAIAGYFLARALGLGFGG